MTISGTYTQTLSLSVSFTAVRLGTAGERQPAAAPSGDTVALSPEATSQASTPSATTESAPAGVQPSPSSQKATALLGALDADRDGSLTKEEFTDGALALLGRPGRGHRRDTDVESGETVERHDHRSRRFERRLEKVFDRVDANDDGTLDASELKNALARTGRKDGKASIDAAPAAQASYASVTVVAVAVKQYTAISTAA